MTAVVRASQVTATKAASRPNLLLISVMVVTVSVLMAAHACEVFVWSFAYGIVDAAPANTNLLYFAFVNYTTLGYGDIVPLHPIARSLCNLESVIGQLYPATLLARLVTIELRQAIR